MHGDVNCVKAHLCLRWSLEIDNQFCSLSLRASRLVATVMKWDCKLDNFLLFSLFLFIVPNSPPLLIPETFQLYSISPLIRVTMQFDAQIALSDNILHKMTQFNRRLCRGKFGPRFLIDFFVKFGARGKKTKKFWFVASERPKLLLRRRHCPATKWIQSDHL